MYKQSRLFAAAIGAILLMGGGPFFWGCQTSALASGKLYLKQQKFDEAREQLELAAKAEPENAEALFYLGRICGVQGDYVELAEAFDRAQRLSPEFDAKIAAERLHYWSRIYNNGVRAGVGRGADLVTSRRHFDTAVRVLPKRLEAWRNRAAVDYELGDVETALSGLGHVLQQAPQDTATARTMGVIYLSQQRYDEARSSFEYVLARGEQRGALINLASTLLQLRQKDKAQAALQRALVLDPDCFTCHYNLGNLFWSSADHGQARDSFARAVDLRPSDFDARYNLAVTLLALDDLDAALPLLEGLSVERRATAWSGASWGGSMHCRHASLTVSAPMRGPLPSASSCSSPGVADGALKDG